MKDKYNLTKQENLFLAKKVLVSNIYNSAKLEGINTTYPDTKVRWNKLYTKFKRCMELYSFKHRWRCKFRIYM